MILRPEVQEFANLMELALQKHDATRGPRSWTTATIDDLKWGLINHYGDLLVAINSNDTAQVIKKSTDIGNYCMMLIDVLLLPPKDER